MKMKLKIKF